MCCACSFDENIGGTSAVKNISATLEPMTFDGQTRTSHTVSDTQGFLSEWAEGDILGIYPVGGDQVAFPISAGAGTSTAKFDGGSWALRPTIKYSAYYPFSKDNYMISQTEIPVNYEGQSQNGNASTEHLGNYYYVAAAAAEPTSTGSVNLAMKHMGSLLNLILTMPVAASYTDVIIETEVEGDYFPITGTIDLTSAAPAITPKTYAHSIHLGLSNVSTAAANQTISLLMMMAPANMQDKNLLVTVTDAEGKTYQFKGMGKTYLAAKAYRLTLTEVIGGTGANLTPDGWDDSDANMLNGHEYVDLGLPSGTLWATCNVGAESPEDYGGYYAWGEIETKDVYTQSSYLYYSNSIRNSEISSSQYDVARQKWGGKWRIPTNNECQELIDNCIWTWTQIKGIAGYKIEGLNGKSIFLPAAGYYRDSSISADTYAAWYWSSTARMTNSAANLTFWYHNEGRDIGYSIEGSSRYDGQSIRPVASSNGGWENGHEYVDLGLTTAEGKPIYWATCNIGAEKPENYGLYFAWGETVGYKSNSTHFFDGYNYKWIGEYYNAEYENDPEIDPWQEYITKYCIKDDCAFKDGKSVLELSDDAAHENWGDGWRMPTDEEYLALINNCSWTWKTINQIQGYEVVGKNGKSIFLPLAGYCSYEDDDNGYRKFFNANIGTYWSSTLVEAGYTTADSWYAKALYFYPSSPAGTAVWSRSDGMPIRSVFVTE